MLMSEPFFFSPLDDKRFLEAKDFLENRSETLDEIRTKFVDQRPILASIMKKKLRTKAKKMEKTSFGTKSGRVSKRKKVWRRGPKN